MAQFMGSPTLVSVLESGTDYLRLSWKPPGAAHNITQYEIQLRALSLPKSIFTGSKEPTYTIRELSPHTNHQFQVRAMYKDGNHSGFSEWVKATTQPQMVSNAPKNNAPGKPRVKCIDLNCLTLEWNPPIENHEYIMCYEVHFQKVGSHEWESCNSDNYEPKIDFLDLDENATYVAKVCAVFGSQTGPFSPESEYFDIGMKKTSKHIPTANENTNVQIRPNMFEDKETKQSLPYEYYSIPTNVNSKRTNQDSVHSSRPIIQDPVYQSISGNFNQDYQQIGPTCPDVTMPFPAQLKSSQPVFQQQYDEINDLPERSPFYRSTSSTSHERETSQNIIKPHNIKAAMVAENKLEITWEFQNNTPYLYCEIAYKKNGKGIWLQEVTDGPAASYILDTDEDAVSYSIRVRCVLVERPGPYSDTIQVQTQVIDSRPMSARGQAAHQRQSNDIRNHKQAEKPGRPQIANGDITQEGMTITWKPPVQTNEITNYEILFKAQDELKWVTEITDDSEPSYTVYGLRPGKLYEFQARAVFGFDRLGPKSEISRQVQTLGGTQGATSDEVTEQRASGSTRSQQQLPNRPDRPEAKELGSSSITLQWNDDDSDVKYYEVDYRVEDDNEWKTIKTKRDVCMHTIEDLSPGNEYTFRVRGVNDIGKSNDSKESFPLQTKRTAAHRVLTHAKKVSSNEPAQYILKLKKGSGDPKIKIQHLSFGSPSQNHKCEKTIMVVGATGSGKSTLINGMVNYLLDVKWGDKFRYLIINSEDPGSNQAHSQTQNITTYKIYPMEGSKNDYTLNIVDTPGFGDTKGIERDKELVEQIRTLFGQPGKLGLQTIDAVCFVAPAAQARLTHTQRYIFDSVLSVFGKDIGDNIVALLTFADGSEPPVLASLREANVPYAESFTFNNSALFESNVRLDSESFSKMFWDMGVQSFGNFFGRLPNMTPKSLTLSAKVLEERKHLEAKVEGLQIWITDGLSRVETLRQEKQILEQHETDIDANKNFSYKVNEVVQKKINLACGEHVTNCLTCNRTCHFPCYIPKDQEKYNCAAMDWQMAEQNRPCTICPGKCIWNMHVNNPYRFELNTETKKKTYDGLKKKYAAATGKKKGQLNVVSEIEKEINKLQGNIVETIDDITNALVRLSEIALKPNPLTNVDYIDLLLASEEQEAKPGYKARMAALQKVRHQAEILERAGKKDLNFFNIK